MKHTSWLLASTTVILTAGCEKGHLDSIKGVGPNAGPNIEITPSSIDFGTTSTPVSRSFQIESVGYENVLIEDILLGGESPDLFAFSEGSSSSFVLEPGEVHPVTVTFSPEQVGSFSAEVIVSSSDEDNAIQSVSLLGSSESEPSLLSADPHNVNFRDIYAKCDDEQEISLSNVGDSSLTVTEISVSSGVFSLASTIDLPFLLEVGEPITLTVNFSPVDDAASTGTLHIGTEEGESIDISLSGQGKYTYTEDSWSEPPSSASDIIFAVDRSCSMDDNQSQLASNFSTFITQLSKYSSDWQIMVIDEDQGCNTTGTLTPSTPNYVTTFQNAVRSGSKGRYTEALLTPAFYAVDKTDAGECNAGFMRSNALLHIILVSDEPEQSSTSWTSLVTSIIAKKGSPDNVRISSIVGDVPGGCWSGSQSADPGTGYVDATNYTGGVFLSICSNWASSSNLQLLAEASVIQDTYELSSPAIGETVEVYINGTKASTSAWFFDEETNSVRFNEGILDEGDTIYIEYALLVCE